MENKTRRIRKARVQGLAARSEPSRVTSRRGVDRSPTRGLDLPAEPRANARKKSVTTTRKAKRAARSTTTRKPAGRSR